MCICVADVQRCRCAEAQRHKEVLEVLECMCIVHVDADVKRQCAEVFRCAEEQRCRDAEVQRCKEVQRCRGAEVLECLFIVHAEVRGVKMCRCVQ